MTLRNEKILRENDYTLLFRSRLFSFEASPASVSIFAVENSLRLRLMTWRTWRSRVLGSEDSPWRLCVAWWLVWPVDIVDVGLWRVVWWMLIVDGWWVERVGRNWEINIVGRKRKLEDVMAGSFTTFPNIHMKIMANRFWNTVVLLYSHHYAILIHFY